LYPRRPIKSYYDITQVAIEERLSIKYVSEVIGVSTEYLKELNPMLTKDIIPSRTDKFLLNIPISSLFVFQENADLLHSDPYLTQEDMALEEKAVTSATNSGIGIGKYQTYTITSGDNLGYIAELYSCRVSDIKRWNGLVGNSLRIGKKLRIYNDTKVATNKEITKTNIKVGFEENEINKQTCNCKVHKIISGDNLWDIAVKYNTTIEKIKSANNIYSSWRLKLGVFLKIPNN